MQSFHWICMPWKRGLSKKIFFDEKITAKNSKYWIWIQKSLIWINFCISCHLRGGPRDTAELGRRVSWRLRSGRAYVSPNVTTLHTDRRRRSHAQQNPQISGSATYARQIHASIYAVFIAPSYFWLESYSKPPQQKNHCFTGWFF